MVTPYRQALACPAGEWLLAIIVTYYLVEFGDYNLFSDVNLFPSSIIRAKSRQVNRQNFLVEEDSVPTRSPIRSFPQFAVVPPPK